MTDNSTLVNTVMVNTGSRMTSIVSYSLNNMFLVTRLKSPDNGSSKSINKKFGRKYVNSSGTCTLLVIRTKPPVNENSRITDQAERDNIMNQKNWPKL